MRSDTPPPKVTAHGRQIWESGLVSFEVSDEQSAIRETLKRVAEESSRVNQQCSVAPTVNSHRHLYSRRTPGVTCLFSEND